ncbi:sulfatase/phosphatase domain-containing protein [Haloferula sargassicola]
MKPILLLLAGLAFARAAERPNIVFLFSDDHALQAISAYGSKMNRTPQIDRLAEQGAVFENSFCANSLCGPSRACILTGKHSHLNGFRRNSDRFDGDQPTFPKMLHAAGYQTAIIGKWHLVSHPQGFDYWEVLPGQGNYYNPDFIQMDGTKKRYTGYSPDIVTDRATSWLDGRDPDKPFLLMCQFKAPHRNWAPAPRFLGNEEPARVAKPETFDDNYEGRSGLLKENEMSIVRHMHWAHDMKFKGGNLFPDTFVDGMANGEYPRMTPEQRKIWDDYYEPRNQKFIEDMKAGRLTDEQVADWKYQRFIGDYLKCVAAVDENVGRVLDYLDSHGLAENTIVIYASDQGFYLGEHGWFDKRWMFEESLKMPFLIRWPGVVKPGTRSQAMIQNIDYAPTFLEAAGVEVPADIQGRSLLPVLENAGRAPSGWRDAIYYAYYENAAVHEVPVHDGIRTGRAKLMYFPRTREWQLFDLEKDPHEMRSVHADPEYAPLLAGMKKRYFDLRKFYHVNTATIPTTRGDEPGWRARNRRLNEDAKKGPFDLAFIGDSITEGWEGAGKKVWDEHYGALKAINLGIGGDRTEHVLWRLGQDRQIDARPKVAVVMIGTNNTGHLMQDPQEVADGVEKILELIRGESPETKILLLGVFPRGAKPMDKGRLNNVAINQIIRRFADGEKVDYLDLSDVFLDEKGGISKRIMPDRLHLSSKGYRLWAEAIAPKLKEMGL